MPAEVIERYPVPPHGLTQDEIDAIAVRTDDMPDLPTRLYWGGTKGMREAGVRYLPREAGEPTNVYESRLETSVLDPFFEDAVDELVSKVIASEVTFSEETPEAVIGTPSTEGWADNLDGAGNNATQFLEDVARGAVVDGLAVIYVDYPAPVAVVRADGRQELPSRVDERRLGRRPVWTLVRRREVLGVETAYQGGSWRLLTLRREECIAEGRFRRKETRAVRLFVAGNPGVPEGDPSHFAHWHLFVEVEQDEQQNGPKYRWDSAGSLAPHVDLPMVPVTGRQYGYFAGESIYGQLADLVGQHWWKRSALDWRLNAAAKYVWHRSGCKAAEANAQTTLGVGRLFWSEDPQARMEVVESTGSTMERLQADLAQLEVKIRALSAKPYAKLDPSQATATAERIREGSARSRAEAFRMALIDAANLALVYTARWADMDSAGMLSFESRDLVVEVDPVIDQLIELRKLDPPGVSLRTLLQALDEKGRMPSGWTWDEEQRRLSDEQKDREASGGLGDFARLLTDRTGAALLGEPPPAPALSVAPDEAAAE